MKIKQIRTLMLLAAGSALCIFAGTTAHAEDFKPVNPTELAMKDNPANPGAHAMILEWDDNEDDNDGMSDHYFRIKIFTEEGKKYGDIEIPYLNNLFNISGVKARTIRPDGTIV